jgi:hypothetical protein
MISGKETQEILAQYAKHGWTLRRVLLSDSLRVNLNEFLQDLFGGAEIVSSPLDALWFSRTSDKGEAWEIRRLSKTPFALVEVFPVEITDAERENKLNELQTRLLNRASK